MRCDRLWREGIAAWRRTTVAERLALALLWALTLTVLVAMWGVSIPRLEALAEAPILDLLPRPTVGEIDAYFEKLGGLGRGFYFWVQLRLDGVFPLLYGVTLTHLLWLVLRFAGMGPRVAVVVAVAVVAPTMVFDLLENHGIAALLLSPPGRIDPVVVAATAAYTQAKWLSAQLAGAFAGIALAVVLRKHCGTRTP